MPKVRRFRTVLAPRIYEGGGPRSGRGSPPPWRGRPSQSRFACQLSQRESQGSCAPFLPPAFMRGEGHEVAGGVPRSGGESLLSHGFAVPAPPEGKPRELRSVLAPRIYEGGGPRSGRGSLPAAAGTALSVTLRAPALPKGEPRGLRTVPAPRIYEGGGPRSGGGSSPQRRGESSAAAGKASSVTASPCQLPQRGSRGRFAPFLSIRNGLRFRFLFAGRGLTGAVYSPPEMQVSVASGRGKWGEKGALWDVHNPAPENFAMFYTEKCIFRHRDRFLHLICFAI